MDSIKNIQDNYNGLGFIFNYIEGELGKSQVVLKNDLKKISPCKHNLDDRPLFVYCQDCGIYMDFKKGHKNDLDGKWICLNCNAEVDEQAVYIQLSDENDEYDEYYQDEYNNDVPEGCQACGGPYPNCKVSCKLFDD